jgi:hypothetical protein
VAGPVDRQVQENADLDAYLRPLVFREGDTYGNLEESHQNAAE